MYDALTNLGNLKFLENNYLSYIKQFGKVNYIMIDFSNFKKINDTYGHEEGDICLISFSDKLRETFLDSLLIRLHGDEFVVVTNHNPMEIDYLLKKITNRIKKDAKKGDIPLEYGFNAGSVLASKNLHETQEKADYMMYYSKRNKRLYQPYEDKIYQEKLDEKSFIDDFHEKMKGHNLSYFGRNLFTKSGNETNYTQVYTRDSIGNSILGGNSYSTLRKTSEIARFDLYNLENIIGATSMINDNKNYFVNIDYRSLLSIKDLKDLIVMVKENSIHGIKNVILAVDLEGIETSEYPITIDIIRFFSELGFKIRLDKVDGRIADTLIESINPDFIKVSNKFWNLIYDDLSKVNVIRARIDLYSKLVDDAVLVFDRIEDKIQRDFVCGMTPDNSLYSGNYYSNEKRLLLKKDV